MLRKRKSLPERLWSQTSKRDGSCWIWNGQVNNHGYGWLRETRKSKKLFVHRLAWQFTYGCIPQGLCVLHSCDVPRCVNPQHLWLGSKADNTADMVAKGRARGGPIRPNPARGEQSGAAKLSWVKIKEIRHLYFAERKTQRELANYYGVTHSSIGAICRSETWESGLPEILPAGTNQGA